jgi:hypothetical protein
MPDAHRTNALELMAKFPALCILVATTISFRDLEEAELIYAVSMQETCADLLPPITLQDLAYPAVKDTEQAVVCGELADRNQVAFESLESKYYKHLLAGESQ